ncbi:MAG: hypothetical protein KGL75_07165, partial [Acidobacteriota bacterium]|nr:hypothetical protein [Acidobacteriota bacterium]
ERHFDMAARGELGSGFGADRTFQMQVKLRFRKRINGGGLAGWVEARGGTGRAKKGFEKIHGQDYLDGNLGRPALIQAVIQ